MNKLPVSVCMISGAESHRIARALESVAGWATEIIVVLNHDVQDGTEEIARRYGAKVYREPWKGYVAQKNSAADKALHPWILSLDADEEMTPALWNEIATMLANVQQNRRFAAFEFPRCSYYCGRWIRHGDWYPDRVLRLWQKGSAAWVGIEIHERLHVTGEVGRLHSDLLHYSIENVDKQIKKIIQYADDFARGCQTHKKQVGFLDLVIRPPWRFFRSLIVRLGFLDGWQGFSIAWFTAFYTFLRYFKALEAQNRRTP